MRLCKQSDPQESGRRLALPLFQDDQEDMYEFLEDDFDPSLSREERRARRKQRVLAQYKTAQAEESSLLAALTKHKTKVGFPKFV